MPAAGFLTDAEYDQRDLEYQRKTRKLRTEIIAHELECMSDDGFRDETAYELLIAEYEAWMRTRF